MAGSDVAGTVLAPVAGVGVAIAVAQVIPHSVAVLGSVPLLVGVAIGVVVTFAVGYAIGDRSYLMVGGPTLHILVGGAGVFGVVGDRLTGFAIAGVGGVGLLLFVARVRTGNLRRHAALPANPSLIRRAEASSAKRLIRVREIVRRVSTKFVGRLTLGGLWIVTTTGLLWVTAAIATSSADVTSLVPSVTLSLVPAAGYLAALFAPFFVWTDWLGLEGIDPEMRPRPGVKPAGALASGTTGGSPTEEAGGNGAHTAAPAPTNDPAEPAGGDIGDRQPPEGTDESRSSAAGETPTTGADSQEDPPSPSSENLSPGGSASDDPEPLPNVEIGEDLADLFDADPDEFWSPGIGDDPGFTPDPGGDIQIPGINDDTDDHELWGGDSRPQTGSGGSDQPDDGSDTPREVTGERDVDPPGDSSTAKNQAGDSDAHEGNDPTALVGGSGQSGQNPPDGEDRPRSDATDLDDSPEESESVPGERVRSYEPPEAPHGGPPPGPPGDNNDDDPDRSITIYGPEDDDGIDSDERGSAAGTTETETETKTDTDTETDTDTGTESESDIGSESSDDDGVTTEPDDHPSIHEWPGPNDAVGDAEPRQSDETADDVADTPDVTSTGPVSDSDSGPEETEAGTAAWGSDGRQVSDTTGASPTDEDSETDRDPDPTTPTDASDVEEDDSTGRQPAPGPTARETSDASPPEPDTQQSDTRPDSSPTETDPSERSSIPEPTRPPVDIDAVEATADDRADAPIVSRDRPVGIRGIDAGATGQSSGRPRASRGHGPRRIDGGESRVPQDGSPSSDRGETAIEGRSDPPPGTGSGKQPMGRETPEDPTTVKDAHDVSGTGPVGPPETDDSDATSEIDENVDDLAASGEANAEGDGSDQRSADDGWPSHHRPEDTGPRPAGESGESSTDDPTDPDSSVEDRSVEEITDSIEENLDRIGTADEGSTPDEPAWAGKTETEDDGPVGVSDRVSSILSGDEDVEAPYIDRSTAEEIADILSGDESEENNGSDNSNETTGG